MTLFERAGAFIALHNPEAWREPMVYSVWEDGEITLEKGGDLFGHRSMHWLTYGVSTDPLPYNVMPWQNEFKHGRIFVDNEEIAQKARKIALGVLE